MFLLWHLNTSSWWMAKFQEFSLKISETKTVVMAVIRNDQPTRIKVGDYQLKSVDNFTYLGSIVSKDNRATNEITNRVQKSSIFYQQVRTLLWDDKIPKKAKVTMFNSYFIPILTYGIETCTLTKRDSSRLQASEMKFLRSIIQKTKMDKLRNEVVRREAGIKTCLQDRVSNSRLQWFGHVMRMEPMRMARMHLEKEVVGKRRVGRPRTCWMDMVKTDITTKGRTLDDVMKNKTYMDREEWKRLVNSTRETGTVNR